MNDDLKQFLLPAPGIQSDSPRIVGLAAEITANAQGDQQRAQALFLWVRDRVAYSMVSPFWDMEHYLAESTLDRGYGYCVQKSALLTTLARAAGIPARMCFADIDNLAIAPQVVEMMGGHTFTYHSYTQWFLDGQWRKATPAFDAALCREHGLPAVEFRPEADLLLPERTLDGRPYIVYRVDHGWRLGVPLEEIMQAWLLQYGPQAMANYRAMVEAKKELP